MRSHPHPVPPVQLNMLSLLEREPLIPWLDVSSVAVPVLGVIFEGPPMYTVFPIVEEEQVSEAGVL